MRHLVILFVFLFGNSWAESKRIEVYPISQAYWDVKAGDTLGEIVDTLIPHNSHLQRKLMQDILALNPGAFPYGDPHWMLANKRLWLPNALKPADAVPDARGDSVETYQWGSIRKRGREQVSGTAD